MENDVAQIIRDRFAALKTRDFSALYASYHPQAPFLEQFPDEESYLEYAQQALAGLLVREVHIGAWRTTAEGVEVICTLNFATDGETQTLFELARLIATPDGWRYHSAQKLTAEDYVGKPEDLDFVHFDRQPLKIRF